MLCSIHFTYQEYDTNCRLLVSPLPGDVPGLSVIDCRSLRTLFLLNYRLLFLSLLSSSVIADPRD